jgi:hypothetical protein
MTRDETALCLALVTYVYPKLTVTEGTLDAWTLLLEDLPFSEVKAAMVLVLRRQTGAWWPTPGEIRQAVCEVRPNRLPTADEAWGQVTQGIRRWGYMRPRDAYSEMHPLVVRVVQNIGWQEICEANPDVIRGQFARFYTEARETATRQALAGSEPALPASPSDAPSALASDRASLVAQWAARLGQRKEAES